MTAIQSHDESTLTGMPPTLPMRHARPNIASDPPAATVTDLRRFLGSGSSGRFEHLSIRWMCSRAEFRNAREVVWPGLPSLPRGRARGSGPDALFLAFELDVEQTAEVPRVVHGVVPVAVVHEDVRLARLRGQFLDRLDPLGQLVVAVLVAEPFGGGHVLLRRSEEHTSE